VEHVLRRLTLVRHQAVRSRLVQVAAVPPPAQERHHVAVPLRRLDQQHRPVPVDGPAHAADDGKLAALDAALDVDLDEGRREVEVVEPDDLDGDALDRQRAQVGMPAELTDPVVVLGPLEVKGRLAGERQAPVDRYIERGAASRRRPGCGTRSP
jgi:hypothetical protein